MYNKEIQARIEKQLFADKAIIKSIEDITRNSRDTDKTAKLLENYTKALVSFIKRYDKSI